jgi:glycosyltransferase involved in cell wall biosynthesis
MSLEKHLVIAVLAHNEADVIGVLLQDVVRQTVFTPGHSGLKITVCIVPNGCSDATAESARTLLGQMDFPAHVHWDVTEVAPASKTNAWNVFVHDIAPDDADYFLFLDADIRLPQQDIIERTVACLEQHPDAWAVSDKIVNVFPEDSGFSLMKLASSALSKTATGDRAGICGQFYCARAERLKRITLPRGLLSQDGFIGAMIVSSALCEPSDPDRIKGVPDAYHLHPAYTKLSQRFRYEKRQAMSTTVYTFIYDMMLDLPPDMDDRMDRIRQLNVEEPDWVEKLVIQRCSGRWFVVPSDYVFKRLKRLRHFWRTSWKKTPWILAATVFDIWVGISASHELRTKAIGSVERNSDRFKIRAGH